MAILHQIFIASTVHIPVPGSQNRLPTGDGATTQWTASAGNKWACVDDAVGAPNDDTDYIYGTGNIALTPDFSFAAFTVPGSAVISKVKLTSRVRNHAGTANTNGRIFVGGSLYAGSNMTGVTSSYADFSWEWTNNPKTSFAWTPDDVNGIGANALGNAQVRTNVPSADNEQRITQVYLTVEYTS